MEAVPIMQSVDVSSMLGQVISVTGENLDIIAMIGALIVAILLAFWLAENLVGFVEKNLPDPVNDDFESQRQQHKDEIWSDWDQDQQKIRDELKQEIEVEKRFDL